MRLRWIVFSVSWLSLSTTAAVFAAMPQWEPPEAVVEPNLAAGIEASLREDWQSVIAHMKATAEQRPWDDDAFTLLGFAYRENGDYAKALEAYERALALNPYHRDALEYLGETLVELGQLAQARAVLERLETVCRQMGKGDWREDCEEWRELGEVIERHLDGQDC